MAKVNEEGRPCADDAEMRMMMMMMMMMMMKKKKKQKGKGKIHTETCVRAVPNALLPIVHPVVRGENYCQVVP